MGILDSLSGIFSEDKEQAPDFSWNELESEEGVDEVAAASHSGPQVILKHSTSCGTSFFAKREVESLLKEDAGNADFHIVDVIRKRPVSSYIAEKFNIQHESPQLLVVDDGKVRWHGSHGSVRADQVREVI